MNKIHVLTHVCVSPFYAVNGCLVLDFCVEGVFESEKVKMAHFNTKSGYKFRCENEAEL